MFGVTLLSLILLATTAHGARLPYIVGGENIDTPGKYPWQVSWHWATAGCQLINVNVAVIQFMLRVYELKSCIG